MFGKLLKYDLRSMWKQFALIWPAALVLAIVNRFTLPGMESTSVVGETTAGISMLVYVAVLMSMIILVIVFVIQRFYKGLLGDEGYLMHTLPVKPWQLIGSKLTCAMVVMIISCLVAMASILLMVPMNSWDFQLFWEEVTHMFDTMRKDYDINFLLIILELVVAMLINMAQAFLHLYLAMAIGHLFSKNRIAASVVAYVAISAAVSAISSALGTAAATANSGLYVPGEAPQMAADGLNAFQVTLLPSIALELAQAAIYYAATNYILKNKLNLE